jgi:hypothetical protein
MPKSSADQYSEKDAAYRRDAIIKHMLNTPPKPHSELKIGKSKKKSRAKQPNANKKI